MKVSTGISSVLALIGIQCSYAAQRGCVNIAGPTINVGDSIDLYRAPTSPSDDVWKGTYLFYGTLPIYTTAGPFRIAEFSMGVNCEAGALKGASPACNFDVYLKYSDTDNLFRYGTFFASGSYDTSYIISGGTDSFNEATGTLNAVFDETDPEWYKSIEIDMCFIYPEVGDTVKCIGDTDGTDRPDTVTYRMTSSTEIQHYKNEAIAFSWQDEWHVKPKDIDCTDMAIGDDIAVKPVGLVDDMTVTCIHGTVDTPNGRSGYYIWVEYQLRELTSQAIANSWDNSWTTAPRLDCTGLSLGEPMSPRPALPDGKSIQCIDNSDGSNKPTRVYRLVDDRLRLYTTGIVANSWNPEWHVDIQKIDCTGFSIGRPMTMMLTGVTEGDTVKCQDNSDLSYNPYNFYRYTHSGLRHYPNPSIASAWDLYWHNKYKTIDCSGIPHIANMS